MREIIGVPIEADDVSVRTSHNMPDLDGEAPDLAARTSIPDEWNGNDRTGARSSIDRGDKTSVGTTSTAPPAHIGGSEPSVLTKPTASTEPLETSVPIPQVASIELSTDSGDALNSIDTTPTVPTLDTEPTRRTVKQRKSDFDEYRRRFMPIPKIEDRKPVFISRATRDRLDRIVRLLGERGMSVSGLVENIALRHLETHEADIELWRKI